MQEERCNLKSLSEAELLESYNRRDNLKVIGLPEVIEDDGKPEAYAKTSKELVKLKVSKIEMLKKKKSLENLVGYANIKVFEDISRPCLAFF